jgi:predicted phage terminase large subunit-like protein
MGKFSLDKLSNQELINLVKQSNDNQKLKMANESYAYYLEYVTNNNYKHSRHTRLICSRLQRIADGEKNVRLIINIAPRHSKSETSSKHFPGYYLGKNSSEEVMIVSYGSSLAEDFSRINREDIRQYGKDIFGVSLSPVKKNVARWEIEGTRGGCTAVGVGGALVGRGCSICCCDDYLKSYEEAMSKTVNDGIWEFWRNVLRTRFSPGASCVIVCTRWSNMDLVQRLVDQAKEDGGEQWEVISLPAICEIEGDILGRKINEPLWPERFDLEVLNSIKSSIGRVAFRTQYQQDPEPLKGYTFSAEDLQYFTEDEIQFNKSDATYYFRGDPIVQTLASVDPASKTEQHNDPTCIIVASITRAKNVLIRLIYNKRINISDQLKTIVTINNIWKPNKFLVEEVNYQNALREVILADGEYVPFVVVKRGGRNAQSKSERINLMSPMFESKKVFIHADEKEFIDQYTTYPSVAHDDILDAIEMILEEVRLLPSYGNISLNSQAYQQEMESYITIPYSKYNLNHFTSSPFQF